ncbi:hypothetical protein J1N35_023101 [Gossypium stocksii]|uniref:Uncharacterized protein n=1 Tax=Gossypium stocksii TaxID=47602 RepID=A0A9D3VHP9_9ROSI|nr:hypothetical protein J1N35_023101 [Gossypium stocksii]
MSHAFYSLKKANLTIKEYLFKLALFIEVPMQENLASHQKQDDAIGTKQIKDSRSYPQEFKHGHRRHGRGWSRVRTRGIGNGWSRSQP